MQSRRLTWPEMAYYGFQERLADKFVHLDNNPYLESNVGPDYPALPRGDEEKEREYLYGDQYAGPVNKLALSSVAQGKRVRFKGRNYGRRRRRWWRRYY